MTSLPSTHPKAATGLDAPADLPAAAPLVLLSEEYLEEACELVNDSELAIEILSVMCAAMTLALVEAGFPQWGQPTGTSLMNTAVQSALMCAQVLREPLTGTTLTLATALVSHKTQDEFGVMYVRWDILRELDKNRTTPAPNRKLVTKRAFEVPAIAPQALTGDASQLLDHLKKYRASMVAKLIRDRAEDAARQLVEVLSP